jgi:hypothetical protein
MDTEIQVFTNDIVKITIDCSSTPLTLNHSDIDKLTNTYEQLCQYLYNYTSHVPPLDFMRITHSIML